MMSVLVISPSPTSYAFLRLLTPLIAVLWAYLNIGKRN